MRGELMNGQTVSVRSRCERKSQDDDIGLPCQHVLLDVDVRLVDRVFAYPEVENRKLASGVRFLPGKASRPSIASVLVLLWPLRSLGSGSSAFALPLSCVTSYLRFFAALLMALFIAAVSEHSAVLVQAQWVRLVVLVTLGAALYFAVSMFVQRPLLKDITGALSLPLGRQRNHAARGVSALTTNSGNLTGASASADLSGHGSWRRKRA
jgi:hypothetical protein